MVGIVSGRGWGGQTYKIPSNKLVATDRGMRGDGHLLNLRLRFLSIISTNAHQPASVHRDRSIPTRLSCDTVLRLSESITACHHQCKFDEAEKTHVTGIYCYGRLHHLGGIVIESVSTCWRLPPWLLTTVNV